MKRFKIKTRWLALAACLLFVASIVLLSLQPHKALAAIAFDKDLGAVDPSTSTTAANTVAFSTSQAAASNSKIIVVTSMNHASTCTLGSITNSGSALTWNVDMHNEDNGNGTESIAIASADAASGLASATTITATFKTAVGGPTNCTSTPGARYIAAASFTGIATGTTYDGTVKSITITSNAWTSGTINTSNANDLIFGLGEGEVPAGYTSCTPSTNYTNTRTCDKELTSDFNAWELDYRIVSATGSHAAGGTFNGGSTTIGAGAAVAYKSGNSSPGAPTLITPASSATGVSTTPSFTFRTTDGDSDYLRYRLYLYQSNCSTVVGSSPFTEPTGTPQTGWTGQDQQSSTAYTGSSTLTSSTIATYTYQGTLSANTTYCWKVDAIDAGGSNSYGSASATQSFTTSQAPAAPTLVTPAASATGVSALPIFQLNTTDAESDYLDYEIQICTTSNCSSVLVTYCQVSSLPNSCTGSQTNWQGQDANSAAAYLGSSTITSSSMARYQYAGTALTAGQQYWWRAYAIDPGGSQTASSASSIGTFTVGATEVKLQGGTTIQGGTIIQ